MLYHFYLQLDPKITKQLLQDHLHLLDLQYEICYNVDFSSTPSSDEHEKLRWLFTIPGFQDLQSKSSLKIKDEECDEIIEIGSRLNQRTPFCTNATSICHNSGLKSVLGIEVSFRYKVTKQGPSDEDLPEKILNLLHDPMRDMHLSEPLTSLQSEVEVQPWFQIDVLNQKSKALEEANQQQGFAFDDWDIKFYSHLFRHKLNRNPTNVECFDLAQSNSEHSRHWFFKAQMVIDGNKKGKTLFEMVTETLRHSNDNNVIAFHDNGSSIRGFEVDALISSSPGDVAPLIMSKTTRHLTLTAETHNFPTGVAPFPGASTGAGGRQRDQHAIGRGSHIVAATAGYCVGDLNLKNHNLEWESNRVWSAATGLASPIEIAIEASNGASNYGNTFGEPLIAGFFRAGSVDLKDSGLFEWLKPIMFSAGVGSIDSKQIDKLVVDSDTSGPLVCKIGGPVYRIGLGGGSASSQMHGCNDLKRDLNAVQRGDGEMQQKLNRVVRSCVELGSENPILSIHDQGAGGNGNVIKEIVDPAGATVYTKAFTLGDQSINSLELWTAEYQESDAILVDQDHLDKLRSICARERCNLDVVGKLNGTGQIILSEQDLKDQLIPEPVEDTDKIHPVNFNLNHLFDEKHQKIYEIQSINRSHNPFKFHDISFYSALSRVLKHPSVCSKRFLTNKVDRSVGGLVAQQQCVGPLHTPLADVAVVALSHFDIVGTATAIGEQPMKMLCDSRSGARMAVAECLTNLVFAPITCLRDVKASANWMWPAKLPGEGSQLYMACEAMCELMKNFGIGIDGGKDSLSMAARVDDEIIKSPPSLVISGYAPCVDITKVVTPDFKSTGSCIIYIPFSHCQASLGGSILAQCYQQLGEETPDIEDPSLFVRCWETTQTLIKNHLIVAGHDVSDGGLVTTILEMSFAGNLGVQLKFASNLPLLQLLFSERSGIVIETSRADDVIQAYKEADVVATVVGETCKEREISLIFNDQLVMEESLNQLRDIWESTSFAMESLQCDVTCSKQERDWLLKVDCNPKYHVTFELRGCDVITPKSALVAILREEGSNGDREMAIAFHNAGFQPYDVTMEDLVKGRVDLDQFQGLVFVGGFSYADVLGSAKGWASCCLFNDRVKETLETFRCRQDTFSLGVCNGCQLMALLGWVGDTEKIDSKKHRRCYLAHNDSRRFESRFASIRIEKSKSLMLQGMEGSVLGVWVAHGEGKFNFTNESLLRTTLSDGLAPVRYVDHHGHVTNSYPLNPNGSPEGIAALCSSDGRHLAMMPHPERCIKYWQFPWQPVGWKHDKKVKYDSPWMKMFQNAFDWAIKNQKASNN